MPPSVISLKLEKQPSTLDDVTFLEYIEPTRLNALIQSPLLSEKYDLDNYSQILASQIYSNEKHQLETYAKKYDKKTGCYLVKYKKPTHKWGRVFPLKSLGLTSFAKKSRNTLIRGRYGDYDLSNAQPSIVYNICKSNNIQCPYNEQYNNNRETILAEVMSIYSVSRNKAKNLFIRLAFFGTLYGWLKECGLDVNLKPTEFISNFIKELNTVANIAKDSNPELYELCRKMKENKGQKNIIGSFFSLYLQEYETRIMECAIRYLINDTSITNHPKSPMKILTYEYDGIKLLKENVELYGGTEKLLNDLQNVILEQTGFSMVFEEKSIDKFYDLVITPSIAIPIAEIVATQVLINTDLFEFNNEDYFISINDLNDTFKLAEIIAPRLRNTLILCNEQWYMLNNDNLWIQQKEPTYYIVNEIRKYIDYSNKTTVIEIEQTRDEKRRTELIKNSKQYIAAYTTTTYGSFISVITKLLKTTLLDNTFGNKLDATTDILAFQNGIVCLKTKIFRKGILSSDYLTSTIPSDYTPCAVERIDFVMNHFKKILNNNDDHLHYFLCCIGACLLGTPEKIKSIFFIVDKTDCGKGDNGKSFIFELLSSLMPNYVYKTKANLIDVKNTKTHKQIVQTKGKRIVYMEELPREKDTNASLLKDIGDGKKLENEIMFGTSEIIILTWVLFALTNHIPNINSEEEAVYNRYRQISFNSHFDRTGQRLDENSDKLLFIADVSLGEIMVNEYSHEIFHILIDYANKFYENKNKLPKIPAQFVKDTADTKLNNDMFAAWFNDNCIVDEEGKVALKQLSMLSGISEQKVKEGMKRRGYKYNKDLCGLGKDPFNKHYKGGYEGCCLKPDEEVDDEDDT